jgi:hypothetical protein
MSLNDSTDNKSQLTFHFIMIHLINIFNQTFNQIKIVKLKKSEMTVNYALNIIKMTN